jgi:O-antigen ligase
LFKKLNSYSVFQISYLLFFIALPFIYSESFIDPVLIPRQSFLTLFLLFIWIAIIFKKSFVDQIQLSRLSFLLILSSGLLVILSFISTSYSNTISESIYVSSKYGIIFLFFMTTYFLIKTDQLKAGDLANGVLLFCFASILYGSYDIIQLSILNVDILSHPNQITSTFGNKNLFASALILSLWSFFYNSAYRVLRYILLFILIVFVFLIQSKIALTVLSLIFLALVIKKALSVLKINKAKTVIALLMAFALLLLFFMNFSKFKSLSNLHTLDTRISLWKNSFEMVKEKPYGVGSGNWQIFFPKYGLSHFDLVDVKNGLEQYQRPHNDFIWILCELGIQGLILYLGLFCLVIIMLIRLMRKQSSYVPFLLLINILGYCAMAFFDFPLERIEHQILLSVIFVVSINSYDQLSERKQIIRPAKYGLIYAALICISLIVCYYRLKGEYFTRQLISLEPSKHPDQIISNSDKACSFFYTIDPISCPLDWRAGRVLFGENKMEEAGIRLEKAQKLTPYNLLVLKSLWLVYNKEGNTVKANECASEISKITDTPLEEVK